MSKAAKGTALAKQTASITRVVVHHRATAWTGLGDNYKAILIRGTLLTLRLEIEV